MSNHLPPNFYIVFPYGDRESTEDLVAASNELAAKLSDFIEFIQNSYYPRINAVRSARTAAIIIDILPSLMSSNSVLLELLKEDLPK